MVKFGPCIVLIQPNSVCVTQVITGIHVKSFEKTQLCFSIFKFPICAYKTVLQLVRKKFPAIAIAGHLALYLKLLLRSRGNLVVP